MSVSSDTLTRRETIWRHDYFPFRHSGGYRRYITKKVLNTGSCSNRGNVPNATMPPPGFLVDHRASYSFAHPTKVPSAHDPIGVRQSVCNVLKCHFA